MAVAQAFPLPDGIKVGLVARYIDASVVQTGDSQRETRFKTSPLARRGWTASWIPESGSVPIVERMFEVFGTHTSFLLRPPRIDDYTETGQVLKNTVTGLLVGDGSTATFQLQITRTLSSMSGSKKVMHPRALGLTVYVGGVAQVLTTNYTVSLTTGIVTFQAGHIPSAASVITADFEYDTPVRWQSDSVETTIQQVEEDGERRLEEINSATLIEVFDE